MTTIPIPAIVTPATDRVVLAHRIRKAKVASERADADAVQAAADAVAARAHLANLEAEYAAVTTGAAA